MMNRDLYLLRNAGGTVTATSDTMTGRRLREQTDKANDVIAQIEPSFMIETGPVAHTVLTGVEYQKSTIAAMRQTASLPNINNILAPVVTETSRDSLKFKVDFDRDIDINQFGAYFQDQMTLTEQIKARIGVRFDQFNVDDIHKNDTLGATRSDGRFSTQAGLVYQPLTEVSLYGGIARGHLSTVSTESARISEPESSTQYEFGVKTMLLDGLLQINAAAFDVTRENFNITVGTEQLPVGAQHTRGLELDLSAQPFESWGITGNFAYSDAVLTSNPADTAAVGKRPVGVPQQSASLWSTYTFRSGMLEGFGIGGGLTYRDAIFLDAHNTRSLPSYVIADMTLLYRARSFEAQINIANIGDLVYYRNGVNSGALPGDPRTIQGSVRINI
jgi:iron complex outermembrane receptor protein